MLVGYRGTGKTTVGRMLADRLGWAFADGALIPISQNAALFTLLGTTYGGDGENTFALPDLRGRDIIGAGQGPGLPNYDIGQSVGAESLFLSTAQMPAPMNAPRSAIASAHAAAPFTSCWRTLLPGSPVKLG